MTSSDRVGVSRQSAGATIPRVLGDRNRDGNSRFRETFEIFETGTEIGASTREKKLEPERQKTLFMRVQFHKDGISAYKKYRTGTLIWKKNKNHQNWKGTNPCYNRYL